MNTTDLPDLAALDDRALDKILAVGLFDLACCLVTEEAGGHLWRVDNVPRTYAEAERVRVEHSAEGVVVDGTFVPRYSADPAAALRVVEAMGERGYAAAQHHRPSFNTPYRYYATFAGPQGAVRAGSAQAATFPRAVALAALTALRNANALSAEALALLTP